MDNFDQLLAEYKSYGELQQFAEAQMVLINELQKKIKVLEEKNSNLEKIMESAASNLEVVTIPITSQELISREQLNKLKLVSSERELTYEECKKVSEYSKILKDINNSEKSIPSTAKKLSSTQLADLLNEQTQ